MASGLSLVTGGAGFIGRHLVQQLLQQGKQVRVLDIADAGHDFHSGVDYIKGSILDSAKVAMALKDVTHLYHLAGNPNLWARDKQDFFRVNYEGTKIVLSGASRVNLESIIYTSSETILKGFQNNNHIPVTEETAIPALEQLPGPYSQSKMLADREAQKAARENLPVVIVYPTTPIGPGDINLTPPTKMLMDFLNGKNPAYLNCHLNYISVEDVALGHIPAAEKGKVGDRYILGNENLYLSEVLDILEDISGKKMPVRQIPYKLAALTARIAEFMADRVTRKMPMASMEGVRLAASNIIFDCSKARTELGLPQHEVREAFERAVHWLREKEYVK